ncbi:MAG: chorismate synthase [Clostridia bacterium]|nr:chorismate synthase [Clostridia bacterium]
MYLVKAGESHGKAMIGILCDVPAGIKVDKSHINALLQERSFALGRSERQVIENDEINLITGIRNGYTLGNNVGFVIENKVHSDYENIMSAFDCDTSSAQVTALRPGHADLPGICRGNFKDARNVLEGASARNTCLNVVGGAVALSMLDMLGIKIGVRVRSLGYEKDESDCDFNQILNAKSPAYSLNQNFIDRCKSLIESAKNSGDTLGGTVEMVISPIKKGFGFYMGEKRVNSVIAQDIMQIQSVKGLYFGENSFEFNGFGSNYHGNINKQDNSLIVSNSLSGGIDGGMTNGDYIKITVALKPIPTTKKGLETIDIKTGEKAISAKERSDITAVFASCSILKCVVATAISKVITERIGCDNMTEIIKRYADL